MVVKELVLAFVRETRETAVTKVKKSGYVSSASLHAKLQTVAFENCFTAHPTSALSLQGSPASSFTPLRTWLSWRFNTISDGYNFQRGTSLWKESGKMKDE